MPKLTDHVPVYNKPRWEAIDDCAFFLVMEGMLTDSESEKVRERLLKRAKKEGLQLTKSGQPSPS